MPLNEDLMKNFSDALNAEIKNVDETMIPLLKVYLDNVRSFRMAFGAEVKLVLEISRNLGEITKATPQLLELGLAIEKLNKVLTPEIIEIIAKLKKE